MEIMPFEQYGQGCKPNDKLTFLKVTKDDASKVLGALIDAEVHANAGASPTTAQSETDKSPEANQDDRNKYPGVLAKYASDLTVLNGRRFKVPQGVSVRILQDMIHEIGKPQFVDLVSLYKTMAGLDGTTTLEGLSQVNSLCIGKYYMLQGDVFQIRADRDYPRAGLNEFSAFGRVNLYGDYFVPVNVELSSTERVPPYRVAAILGKITGFTLGQNLARKQIIVPNVRVMALASPSSCCGYPDEVIINEQ
jgi:hypothetical protein